MYQRSKIQEESLYYETLKHNGDFPIIGVNTFLSSKGSPTVEPKEVIRASEEEKQYQITMLSALQANHKDKLDEMLNELQRTAIQNQNIFEQLMEVCKYASLGQITKSLFEVIFISCLWSSAEAVRLRIEYRWPEHYRFCGISVQHSCESGSRNVSMGLQEQVLSVR
ncbi:hypothetical protein D3C85_1444470 [compost metagenome]